MANDSSQVPPLFSEEFYELSGSAAGDNARLNLPLISEDANSSDLREALREALRSLSKLEAESALDEASVTEVIGFFCRLYGREESYRHFYSDVCGVMYEHLTGDGKLDDGIPFEDVTLANNMEIIQREANRRDDITPNVRKCITKLYDHIELENTRLRYMVKQNKVQMQNAAKLQSDMEAFDEKVNDTQERLQRNYVTILGIFAAIVITFTAATSFSSAVLQSMNNVSIYRLSFVIVVLAIVLFDVVISLYYFICRVSKFEEGKYLPRFVIGFNIILLLALLAIFFAWKLQLLVPGF